MSYPCPRCGAGTEVKDVRPRGAGVWRRRECPQCLHGFETREQLVKDHYTNHELSTTPRLRLHRGGRR